MCVLVFERKGSAFLNQSMRMFSKNGTLWPSLTSCLAVQTWLQGLALSKVKIRARIRGFCSNGRGKDMWHFVPKGNLQV